MGGNRLTPALAGLAAVALLLAGCGGSDASSQTAGAKPESKSGAPAFDASTPSKAVENYLKTLAAGDAGEALEYLSPSERPEGSPVPAAFGAGVKDGVADIKVGEGESAGDGVRVPFSYRAAGGSAEGSLTAVASPEGGYRLTDGPSTNAAGMFGAMPMDCGDVAKGAITAPGVYDVDCATAIGDYRLAYSTGTGETTESVKVSAFTLTDAEAAEANMAKVVKSSLENKLSRTIYISYVDDVDIDLKSVTVLTGDPSFAEVRMSGSLSLNHSDGTPKEPLSFDRTGDGDPHLVVPLKSLLSGKGSDIYAVTGDPDTLRPGWDGGYVRNTPADPLHGLWPDVDVSAGKGAAAVRP